MEKTKMMKIEIDLELLSKLDLSPNEYVFLYYKFNCLDLPEPGYVSKSNLEHKGFIKISDNDCVILRTKALSLFSGKPATKQDDLSEFSEKYRILFPLGVRSGGRMVRSDPKGCLKKLKAFFIDFPNITKEDVIDATKAYIDLKRKSNYSMMVCADFFISKEGSSQLFAYCEDIKLRGEQVIKSSVIGNTKSI